MKTTVYRIDLGNEPDIGLAIEEACDKQADGGKHLASAFVWQGVKNLGDGVSAQVNDLVLIFQG